MDILTLKQNIADALRTSSFQTSGAALGSAPVTRLLSAHLGADTLRLTGASRLSETDTSITLGGTLGAAVHGLTGLVATATFTLADASVQLSVLLTGLPPGWKPSQSFPALKWTSFDAFDHGSPARRRNSRDSA